PRVSGSRLYYHELAKRLPNTTVLTGHAAGEEDFDHRCPVRIIRRALIGPPHVDRRFRSRWLHFVLVLVPCSVSILVWTLFEILRRRPHVIHAGHDAYSGVAARVFGRVFGIPYVVYSHGEDVGDWLRRR